MEFEEEINGNIYMKNKTIKKITTSGYDFWVCGSNYWDPSRFTREEAIKASKTLVRCEECFNCENCTDCIDCQFCTDCVDCLACSYCNNCEAAEFEEHKKNIARHPGS